jgi:hypothetical protein
VGPSALPYTAVDHHTAAAHVCREVPVVSPDATAADVRTALSARPYDSVVDIAVCRASRLVGLVPVELVLAAPGEVRIESLMDPDPPAAAPGTDQEVAAWKAACSAAPARRGARARSPSGGGSRTGSPVSASGSWARSSRR